MVNTCVVRGCKQESYPGCGISFRRIPVNKEWRALWVDAMNLDTNVTKTACVCSLHFTDDAYLTVAKNKSKPQAVPSVLPKIVSESKKFTVLRIQKLKGGSFVHTSYSSHITVVGTSYERRGPSSKRDDVEISGEPPNKKNKNEDSSNKYYILVTHCVLFPTMLVTDLEIFKSQILSHL
ncbi:uncharacterized protein LOC119191825 [Manduca sexta]|uniref:uncharacterized protein LOC119191825 n=1 Tax=Manduca sexta TaxID=7130 RepID=UPI00188E6615|nr:uncharacterized protein LOC119191825 [Manduca sexta]